MNSVDIDVVAPLVVEYYNWLTDNGGASPEVLLKNELTPSQRRLLLDRMDDIVVIYGLVSATKPSGVETHSAEN